MNDAQRRAFCDSWLAAWTGNRPDELLKFYAEDCYYQDPSRPGGLHGHAELRPYLVTLLAANPDWTWEAVELLPTERGFCCKWRAMIPFGDRIATELGLDIVELDGERITRNEVYFDRAQLLTR